MHGPGLRMVDGDKDQGRRHKGSTGGTDSDRGGGEGEDGFR